MFLSVGISVYLWTCFAHTHACGCNFILTVYIFSLDSVVHFISLVYTGSVLCTENVDLSDVLLRVSFPISVHTSTAVVIQR